MTTTVDQKFIRRLDDPIMLRAIAYGEALLQYPYEQIDGAKYIQLRNVVNVLGRFLGKQNGKEK